MFAFRSLSAPCMSACETARPTREKHLRRQTLQLLLDMLHHVKSENCTLLVVFQDPRCPDPLATLV